VILALIRKWGKVLAYVNEQVQEHLTKVVTQLLYLASRDQPLQEPPAISSQACRRHHHHGHAAVARAQAYTLAGHVPVTRTGTGRCNRQCQTTGQRCARSRLRRGRVEAEGGEEAASVDLEVQLDLEVERLVSPAGGPRGRHPPGAARRPRMAPGRSEWGGWTVQ
jgi:hypothetical protein